jgi:hypothetical protein
MLAVVIDIDSCWGTSQVAIPASRLFDKSNGYTVKPEQQLMMAALRPTSNANI